MNENLAVRRADCRPISLRSRSGVAALLELDAGVMRVMEIMSADPMFGLRVRVKK